MITPTRLKTNSHYNSLDHIQKKMIIKKKNLEEINRGVNMSKLKSFDFWVKTCSPLERIKLIVEEFVADKRRNCDCWLENYSCKCDV